MNRIFNLRARARALQMDVCTSGFKRREMSLCQIGGAALKGVQI